jgi:hypothetical protein
VLKTSCTVARPVSNTPSSASRLTFMATTIAKMSRMPIGRFPGDA